MTCVGLQMKDLISHEVIHLTAWKKRSSKISKEDDINKQLQLVSYCLETHEKA